MITRDFTNRPFICIGGPFHGREYCSRNKTLQCVNQGLDSLFGVWEGYHECSPDDFIKVFRSYYTLKEFNMECGGLTLTGAAYVWDKAKIEPEVAMMSLLGFYAARKTAAK